MREGRLSNFNTIMSKRKVFYGKFCEKKLVIPCVKVAYLKKFFSIEEFIHDLIIHVAMIFKADSNVLYSVSHGY